MNLFSESGSWFEKGRNTIFIKAKKFQPINIIVSLQNLNFFRRQPPEGWIDLTMLIDSEKSLDGSFKERFNFCYGFWHVKYARLQMIFPDQDFTSDSWCYIVGSRSWMKWNSDQFYDSLRFILKQLLQLSMGGWGMYASAIMSPNRSTAFVRITSIGLNLFQPKANIPLGFSEFLMSL